MTDGAGLLMRVKRMLPFKTRYVLDYFHIAMKLRHIDQCIGKILPRQLTPGESIFELYDRCIYLRAYVWMGRRDRVAQSIDRLICLLERIYSSKSVAPYSTTSSSRRSGEITY
jgi:hypothetical protein